MQPGQSLGPYTVLEPLGSGGMGEVYLCEDRRLGRRVALKVLASGSETDAAARRRLINEARTASALNHPQICTIYDVGVEDDQVFIALEHIDGDPLRKLIGDDGLAPETAADYVLAAAEHRFLFPTAVATAYAALGEVDAALEWLEKGREERDLFMVFAAVDPVLRRALGGDPRYLDLLERLNVLPPESVNRP